MMNKYLCFNVQIMYKMLVMTLCLMLGAKVTIAQPEWSVDPDIYQYSMTFTTVILQGDSESQDSLDMIAAFVGDECHGIAHPVFNKETKRYVAYLMVYGNNIEGDTLIFKAYDDSEEKEHELFNHVPFESNAIYGSPGNPLKNLVEDKMTAYNFISPNNDMINDEWEITFRDLYIDFSLSIFNNIGEEMYSINSDYQNDWEGTFDGSALPNGTYYYVAISPNDQFVYKGVISLIK